MDCFSLDEKYFKRNLDILPSGYISGDTNRMTLIYFAISGLDLLQKLDTIPSSTKKSWIDWVYAQQITDSKQDLRNGKLGFRGGPFSGAKFDSKGPQAPVDDYDTGHLAMTYTALLILMILGDDLSRVNKTNILNSMKYLQSENGSFIPCRTSKESDMRFLFCACAISYILNDWNGVNTDLAYQYIMSSMSYDGGFGQGPSLESHGGTTYCAIASLYLMNRLHSLTPCQRKSIQLWCLQRQGKGFQGRIGKDEDTCYAFWIGASINMLESYEFVNKTKLFSFLESTHTKLGGFSKLEGDEYPDLLHSYFGIAGLSIAEYPALGKLFPALNISERAFQFMKENSVFWKAA